MALAETSGRLVLLAHEPRRQLALLGLAERTRHLVFVGCGGQI
jgi:hypothetical protein